MTRSRANLFRYPPGSIGRRHIDPVQEEVFVVLEGTLTIHMGEGDDPERHELARGSVLVVQPGTALQLSNRARRGAAALHRRRAARARRDDVPADDRVRLGVTKRAIRARELLAPVLLQEVPAPASDLCWQRAGDVGGEPLGMRGEKTRSESENSTSAGFSQRASASRTRSIAAADGWSGSVGTSSGNARAPAFASATGKRRVVGAQDRFVEPRVDARRLDEPARGEALPDARTSVAEAQPLR